MKWPFFVKSRFSKILFVSVGIHFLLIVGFCLQHLLANNSPKPKIVVRSQPRVEFKLSANLSSGQKEMSPQKSSTIAKTSTKNTRDEKKIPSKASISKSSQTTKKTRDEKKAQSEIAKQMVASLEALNKSPENKTKVSSSIVLPKQVDLSKTQNPVIQSSEFSKQLASFLQSYLELPEFGFVIAKIEINRSGKVMQVEILESKSKKNAEFLKNRLLDLDVSGLNEEGPLEKNYEYTITFKNNETSF